VPSGVVPADRVPYGVGPADVTPAVRGADLAEELEVHAHPNG
jgi:hypothetical protein